MIDGTVLARESCFTGLAGSAETMLVDVVIGAGGLVLNIVRIDLYEMHRVLRLPVNPRLV
jgi:hypothetical protein